MLKVHAQNKKRVSGTVTDSAKVPIPGISVLIIAGSDTVRAATDRLGGFEISKIKAEKFSIQVSALGYYRFSASYAFADKEGNKQLDTIILKKSSQMLDEVVINSKPNPIRFMQDTVEYNASSFEVHEGDNVADLLKEFPGIEVDDEYNVKTMGQNVVKLRVNGVDFFTTNVKEFIAKLPAGIVSKIQIIDSFGEEANFTGIKIGEPIKMLNIVTKSNMGNGTFGNVSANTGTNDMIGSNAHINLWKKDKQSSARVNGSTLNNGAGNSRALGFGLTHRDKLGKNGTSGFDYNYYNNENAFAREQVIESLLQEGNFLNNSKSEGKNGGKNHTFNWNTTYNNKKVFLQAFVNGGYSDSDNENSSLSNQYGLVRQDQVNINSSNNSSPSVSSYVTFSKKLKKDAFTINASFSSSATSNDQNIQTNTLYYDKLSGDLLKDSLLNRDLIGQSTSQRVGFGLNYSVGLKKTRDTLGRQSLNMAYTLSSGKSSNEVSTFALNNFSNALSFVDSLSTSFRTTSLDQSLGLNYNYDSRKMRYNLGFNAKPNMVSNRDLRLLQTIQNNTFNYSPNLNFSRTMPKGKTLAFVYYGSNQNPTINQLQPVRNAQNLQNIVVGNPELKPSFKHNMNTSFNHTDVKSGSSVQVGVTASSTQRAIVENVTLIPDTLNSLKQITRYENVNGNYLVNGNYQLFVPVKEKKLSVRYSGSLGFSNRAIIFNNQKTYGKGLNYNQELGGSLSLKKLTLNTSISYSVSNNSNANSLYNFSGYQSIGIGAISSPAFFKTKNFRTSVNGTLRLEKLIIDANLSYNANRNDVAGDQAIRNISDVNMNVSSRLTIQKSYFINSSVLKRVNYGYALANTNPLIINASLEKAFLREKSLTLSIRGNDLLGQGNNISRIVTGNTIVDSRNNQQTRVVSINLNYNLSEFGGRHMRVNAD